MGVDDKTKHKIVAIISALQPHAKIYLFGSRARGTASKWSDIDLALDADQSLNYRDLYEINDIMKALRTPYKIDVVDFNTVSDQMREEITRDKLVWKA